MAAKKNQKRTARQPRELALHLPDLDQLIPEQMDFTIRMPDLLTAIRSVIAAAVEANKRDPRSPEELKLEQDRIVLDQDRQKLQWAEHQLRVTEFEQRRREEEERRAEREAERAERQERERQRRENQSRLD
jgi:hypothetical protein